MSCGQEDVQGKERKAAIEKEYKKGLLTHDA